MSKVKRHTMHRKNIWQLILNKRFSISAIYINQQDQQCSRKNGQRIWTQFREMKCQWLNIWKDSSVFFSKCNFEILILCIFFLWWNVHNIKLTIFKCIVQWHEVYLHSCATISTFTSRTFFIFFLMSVPMKHVPIPSPPSPWLPLLCFLPLPNFFHGLDSFKKYSPVTL